MDSPLISEDVKRCSAWKFFFWSLPWLALLAYGGVGAFLCLFMGLNQTNMSNIFAFALWIVFDLSVIALGAGAFFTGFLTYIIGRTELKDIINAAVIVGFICYSGAVAMLGIDLGQPLRGWFIFWHANVHSMLTEVSFCITAYLGVLTIEYLPLILENRKVAEVRDFRFFGHNLHHIMAVFAASASYVAVPAAMRGAIPEANPALSIASALGITFTFNVLIGINLYYYFVNIFYSFF